MAVVVTHVTVATDPETPLLDHDDWNAGHTVTGLPSPADSVVVGTSFGQASAVGVLTDYARKDHGHGTPSLGTSGSTAAAGNDSRLSDSRTPTAHASSHTTGSDKIATGTPDGTKFLRDDFVWAAAGGAGGLSWTQEINESGSSFTNFTQLSGTWSSDGTIIQSTETGASRRAKYNTKVPIGFGCIMELELRFPSSSGSGNRQAGFLIGFAGTDTGNGLGFKIDRGGSGVIDIDQDGSTTIGAFNVAISLSTWYKMRAVIMNDCVTVYLDGVHIGNSWINSLANAGTASFVGLFTYTQVCDFRNIKAWTLRGGAPA